MGDGKYLNHFVDDEKNEPTMDVLKIHTNKYVNITITCSETKTVRGMGFEPKNYY